MTLGRWRVSTLVSVGARLGRYEIRSRIGAGGMGEVYLAQDTELDRTVAIKILPQNLASDPQRLQRFVQEGTGFRLGETHRTARLGRSPI